MHGSWKNKTIIHQGTISPRDGQIAKIHYTLRDSENRELDSSLHGTDCLEFTVGLNQVVPDLELAVRSMKVGEVSKFELVSGDVLEIDLMNTATHVDKGILSVEERLNYAVEMKSLGMRLYQERSLTDAAHCFKIAVDYIDDHAEWTNTMIEQAAIVWSSCCLNCSQCFLNAGNYAEASMYAQKVLSRFPHNRKALYRYCLSEIKLGNAPLALKTVGDVFISNESDEVRLIRVKLREAVTNESVDCEEFYRRMF